MAYSILILALLVSIFPARAAVSVRLLLGVGDSQVTVWDGGVTAGGARITALEPWRFDGTDERLVGNQWKASSRRMRGFLLAGQNIPFAPNGVVVTLDREADDATLAVHTANGDFSLRLGEIPYGTTKSFLGGKVEADRLPAVVQLTKDAQEQDYPAVAAAKDGTVWLAYMEFKHHPDHERLRNTAKLSDELTAKPGGDQILLMRYSGGAWSAPIAITPPGGDLYRPAVAVDGKGRPWVFWSANDMNNAKANFDLFALAVENSGDSLTPGPVVRLSSAPGSDINPAATTDSTGRVWVAWQGWRGGKAQIFAAVQNGDGFSEAPTVASSAGNEWDPAIATGPDGRVTVAWDSYRYGQYDVFFRTAVSHGTAPPDWGKEMPAAASLTYEAYPSIAYDPAGVLWIAYEEGSEQWGKDFGSYETTGVSIYEGRAIRLRGFTADGRVVEPVSDLGKALPGALVQGFVPAKGSRQADAGNAWLKPDPKDYTRRKAGGTPLGPNNDTRDTPRNSMPRLVADSSGRLWLAYRSKYPYWWCVMGTVWSEHLTSYNGSTWTDSVYLHHTDNLLDNRPALVAVKPGELLIVGSSDGRRQYHLMATMAGVRPQGLKDDHDPYQNDLYAQQVVLGPAARMPATKPVHAVIVAGKDPRDRVEEATVAMLRNYRFHSSQGELRILRGEFHRHSENSMDGGNDGTLIDQYRYMLDAAHMDWVGCCDHDNGGAREYSWWISQKVTDIFYNPGAFVPMFSYERSVAFPEGHRNVIFAQRGVRVLPRLPISKAGDPGPAPDTQMLYEYLRKFDGIVASHTSATVMGTDWRNNDPDREPAVEIYQGDRQNYEMPGAPRNITEEDAIGGWRPKGMVNLALEKGYKMAFEASSDHTSTHMAYTNILARDTTREAVLEAFKKRHVYGSTDDALAEFTCGSHMMGDEFSSATAPVFRVKLAGTKAFAKVQVIKDNQYVYSARAGKPFLEFTWKDNSPAKGKTSYYYVRGEQADGEIVWVSPMWVTYTGQ